MNKKGFTLIELLVVIAIIALLLAILVPALNIVKMQATGILCSSNNRALAQIWQIYSGDNDSKLCGGNTYNNDQWLGPPVDDNGNAHTNLGYQATLEEEIRGYENGQFWPYLGNHKIYHCPGDGRWKQLPRGYRDTSIQGYMNGESWNHNPNTTPPSGYAEKMSQIISPGNKYVFIENIDPRGWNGGSWVLGYNSNSTNPSWIDPIAIFHADQSTLGFADGHAEKHRWLGKKRAPGTNYDLDETIPWALKATTNHPGFDFYKPVNWGTGEEDDIRWLARGYIPGNR